MTDRPTLTANSTTGRHAVVRVTTITWKQHPITAYRSRDAARTHAALLTAITRMTGRSRSVRYLTWETP